MSDRVTGLSAAETLFEGMSDQAKEEVATLLGEIAADALTVQRGQVPVASGDLKAGLVSYVQTEALRARVGLLNLSAGRAKLFYGRPVDRGIRDQVVLVQRRRRVGGLLRTQSRGSRKRASDIVSTYSLHVKARPGTQFIEAPDLDEIASGKLDAFWDRLNAVGGGQ